MALPNAERQARWQAKRKALEQSRPDLMEQALLREVERCERGELSIEERAALADALADTANRLMQRSQKFAALARKIRPPGWVPPFLPR